MANAKSTTPALRFKGFVEEWEERKLGNVGQAYTGLSGKSKRDFGHGSAKYVTYMNVLSNAIANPQLVESVEVDAKQNEVKSGDVFFTVSSETPEEVGMSSVWLENKPNTYLNSFCFGYRPIEKFDSFYLAHMLRAPSVRSDIAFLAQGISRFNISKNKVMEIAVSVPLIAEQEKIGSYFQNLDSLIALQRRKLVKLQNVKKAMLQKMFPTRGSTTPQIRFAGFTEPWQERKLGDISDIKTGPFGSTLHAGDYVSEGAAIITTEHFKNGELPEIKNNIPQVSKEDVRRLQSYVLNTDDIVFSRVGSVDINALITSHQNGWLFSGRVLRVRTNKAIDSQYLHYELSTERARNDVIGRAVGQTMPSINTEILKQTTVYLPTKIAEQIKIGDFFKHLDTRISLQQRKLEKLQNVKKACLAAMFV